jgi:hypothetical protein
MVVRCTDGPMEGREETVPDDAPPGWEFEVVGPPQEGESELQRAVYRLEEGGKASFVREGWLRREDEPA